MALIESLLSVSAAGSCSASTQYRANTVAFFSVPDFVAAITARPGRSSAGTAPPLALVVSTTSWRRAGIRSHIAAISARGHIRPDQVELVLDAVEGAMTNQNQHKIILCLRIARHCSQCLLQLRRRGLCTGQRIDMCRLSPALNTLSRSFAAAVNRCS